MFPRHMLCGIKWFKIIQSRISHESFESLEYATCFQAISHTARSFARVCMKNDWELECISFECFLAKSQAYHAYTSAHVSPLLLTSPQSIKSPPFQTWNSCPADTGNGVGRKLKTSSRELTSTPSILYEKYPHLAEVNLLAYSASKGTVPFLKVMTVLSFLFPLSK